MGSTRAAQYIAAKRGGAPEEGFEQAAAQALEQMGALARRALQPQGNVRALWAQAARRMSECGAAIRDGGAIAVYLAEVKAQLASFERNVTASEAAELRWVYRLRDMLISQYAYLAAMLDYMQQGGKSRAAPCIQTLRAKSLMHSCLTPLPLCWMTEAGAAGCRRCCTGTAHVCLNGVPSAPFRRMMISLKMSGANTVRQGT